MTVLPECVFETLQDPDAIDSVAAELAHLIVAGDLDDTEGRLLIGSLLFYSKMPTQVARATLAKYWEQQASSAQVREDLALRCIELLQRKVSETTFFDVSRIANGASFTGWCRNLLTNSHGAQSELRNLATAYRKAIPSSQRIGEEDERPMFCGAPANPADAFHSQPAVVALAAFSDQVHGAREQQRKQLEAQAVCRWLDLPKVKPLKTTAARSDVEEQLEQDPKVAYRAVSALRAGLVTGDESPLAQVFAHFSPDDLETLVEKDWRVAAVLAAAAAAAVPPVVQKVAAELISDFVQLVQPGSPAAHMAKLTVRAWLAASTTMIGDEFSRGWRFKTDEQVSEEAAEFTRQATRLVRSCQIRGMVKASDVERWLERRCEELQIRHSVGAMDARAGSLEMAG